MNVVSLPKGAEELPDKSSVRELTDVAGELRMGALLLAGSLKFGGTPDRGGEITRPVSMGPLWRSKLDDSTA